MATWTQADVDTLKAAVASGILTVTFEGPPKRSITYQSLTAMRDLLGAMQMDVAGSSPDGTSSTSRGSYTLAATSKGL